MLSLSLVAPLESAERLLLLRGYRHRVLWSTSADDEHSGVGAAVTLTGSGESRFVDIRDGATRHFHDLDVIALDGSPAPPPRLVGGFAFQPGQPQAKIWQGFGAALFVLPRIAYTRHARRAWLTLTASERELASAAGRIGVALEAREALDLLGSGTGKPDPEAASRSSGCVHIEESVDDWSALVAGICAEIFAGRIEKAVAVRRVGVHGARLPHPAIVIERLRRDSPACTRFALTVGERTFLGASPETLVRRVGPRVMTEAIAGSMPHLARDTGRKFVGGTRPPFAGDTGRHPAGDTGEPLRWSDKDCAEHAIVVREIRAALAPLCAPLTSDAPAPLRLRHLLHLRPRFAGILKQPHHVLDLVGALHPTPAVGGTPRSAALAWLDRHEHADRGLFGGPFGAFDSTGDGHFIVAIRSGLLEPDLAHVFAGAGIVAGSQALAEFAETGWKLRSLMAAIGVR